MAIPEQISDKINRSYREDLLLPNSTRQAVTALIESGLINTSFDTILATYPTTSSEQYEYKLLGSTVFTITVTYTDSTKEVLTSVVRT